MGNQPETKFPPNGAKVAKRQTEMTRLKTEPNKV